MHVWAGLLTFSHFVVYGIAGLSATFQTSKERDKTPRSVRVAAFQADPHATDRQVAAAVYRTLRLPLTRPMPDWFLKRTPEGHLLLDFYQINGIYRVIVLENEKRLRIEEIRNNSWLFLEDMHAIAGEEGERMRLLRLWGFYNQFAMCSLLAMTLSGIYLWTVSRPRLWWALASFGAGWAVLAALYLGLR